MRDEHAALFYERLLVLVRVDAVRHNAGIAPAKQAKLVVRVAVMLRARAQLADPVDLAEIFGQMALHRKVKFFAQSTQRKHEIIRA